MSHSSSFEVFRKGSIVPRRLRKAICSSSKGQHGITFGTDVVLSDGIFYGYPKAREAFLNIKNFGKRMANGTYKKSCVRVDGVSFYHVKPVNLQLSHLTSAVRFNI